MAESIGKLAAQITANSDNFASGMEKAIKKLEEFGKASSRVGKLTKTALKLGGIGAAVNLVAGMIESSAKEIKTAYDEAAEGTISFEEAQARTARGLAHSVPVAGRFVSAMEAVADAIDSVWNAARNFNLNNLDRQKDRLIEFSDEILKASDAMENVGVESIKSLERELAKLQSSGPGAEARLDIGFDFEDQTERIKQWREEADKAERTAERLRREAESMRAQGASGDAFQLEGKAAELDQQAKATRKQADEYERLASAVRDARMEIADTEDGAKAGEAALAVFDQLQAAIGGIDDEIKRLGGATELEITRDRLIALGATADQIDRLTAAMKDLDAAQAAADKQRGLEDFAASVIEDTLTPMEKYEAQIGKLDEALAANLLTWDQYARGVRAAREELESLNRVDAPGAPAALERGSAGAFSAERRAMSAASITPKATPEEKDTAKNTKSSADRLNEILQTMKANQSQTIELVAGGFN